MTSGLSRSRTGAPLHKFQFMRLGQRKARAYLAKRGAPRAPIPYGEIDHAMKEDTQRRWERAER